MPPFDNWLPTNLKSSCIFYRRSLSLTWQIWTLLDTSVNFWALDYCIFFILLTVTCLLKKLFGSFLSRGHV